MTDQKHNRNPDRKSQKERVREITEQLRGCYWVRDEPPPLGKDCNDYLIYLRQRDTVHKDGRGKSRDQTR